MHLHITFALLIEPHGSGLAVAVGLASAAAFATSNALQHRVAGRVPPSVTRAFAVLRHLARQPAWVVATGISTCALLLHAVALRMGSVALVQPLMLVGVVLAVPVRAALERKLPPWGEVKAVGVIVVGLAVFILCANPEPSHAEPALGVLTGFVLVCFGVTVGALRASRRMCAGAPHRQAAMLGVGAGFMFGATAGLLKVVGTMVGGDRARLPVMLVVLAMMVAAGLLGTAMNQRAYQLAPIAYSMPLVNVVDIIVAVAFGAAVYGEVPGHSATLLGLQLTALGCVAVGLRAISGLRTDAGSPTIETRPDCDATRVTDSVPVPAGALR